MEILSVKDTVNYECWKAIFGYALTIKFLLEQLDYPTGEGFILLGLFKFSFPLQYLFLCCQKFQIQRFFLNTEGTQEETRRYTDN